MLRATSLRKQSEGGANIRKTGNVVVRVRAEGSRVTPKLKQEEGAGKKAGLTSVVVQGA